MKLEQSSLAGLGFAIIILQAKHAGASVLTCYSIPTHYIRCCSCGQYAILNT